MVRTLACWLTTSQVSLVWILPKLLLAYTFTDIPRLVPTDKPFLKQFFSPILIHYAPYSCCWPPCGLRGHIRDRVKPRARKKVDSSTSCVFLLLLGSFFRIIRAILSLLFVLEIPSGKIYTYHLHRKNISGQI